MNVVHKGRLECVDGAPCAFVCVRACVCLCLKEDKTVVQNAGNPQCDCYCLPFERDNFQAKQRISEIPAGGGGKIQSNVSFHSALSAAFTHTKPARDSTAWKKKERKKKRRRTQTLHVTPALHSSTTAASRQRSVATVCSHLSGGEAEKATINQAPTHLPLFSFKKKTELKLA